MSTSSRTSPVTLLAVLLLVLVGACSSTPDTEASTTSKAVTSTTEAATTTSGPPTTLIEVLENGDIIIRTGPYVPMYDPIRYVHPNEWAEVQVQCLAELGWDAILSWDGGVLFPEIPEAQGLLRNDDIQKCDDWYPVEPRFHEPLTDEQLEMIYRWHIEKTIPCLQARGYDDFTIPSLETFLETYHSPANWDPFGDIADQAGAAFTSLLQACPQVPPIDDLYGPP